MESINYKELSEDSKKELQKVFQNIDKVWEFSGKANHKLFVYIFGERMGTHYWEKFTIDSQRDVLRLIRGMDSGAKGDLFANIFLNESLYANAL